MAQLTCPACHMALPADPGALGWHEFGAGWWCPLHAPGERSKRKKEAEELRWYDENIRQRERVVNSENADKERELAFARRARVDRDDPHVQHRLAEIDARVSRAREQLTELRRERDAAVERHARRQP